MEQSELERLREENEGLKTLIREMFKELRSLVLSFRPENPPPELETRITSVIAGLDNAVANICPDDRGTIN